MRRGVIPFLLISLFVLGCSNGNEQQPGGDLEEYLKTIQEKGMSERADPDLRTVGSILIGHASLSFQRSGPGGRCWPRFTSNNCPNPDMTAEERQEFARRSQLQYEELLRVLKPMADLDGSGFVSTEEAREFRGLFEFGCLAQHVRANEGEEAALLASAAALSPEVLPAKARQFNELCRRLQEADPRFDVSPIDSSWLGTE